VFLLLAIMLVCMAWSRLQATSRLFPYSQHVDEGFFSAAVWVMIRNGDANPQFFRYPSLPLYLATGSMLAGAWLRDPDDLERLRGTRRGAPCVPSELYWPPRVLFALMSVATVAFLAIVARRAFGPVEALLVPSLVSLSAVFQRSAVTYLNVDVVTVFFVGAALAVVLTQWDRDTWWSKSILPGILSGMSVASKYNSGLILVPCALAILFQSRHRPRAKLIALGAASAIAFFVCVPYSILDMDSFVRDVLWEIEHYRTAKGFSSGEPGLPQLKFYWASLLRDYGPTLMYLSLIGVAYGMWIDWRRTLTVISLPLLMLLHMSTNSVHSLRSILPVFALSSVLQAAGVCALLRMLFGVFSGGGRQVSGRERAWRSALPFAAAGVLLIMLFRGAPWQRVLDRNVEPEPRNVALAWLEEHRQERSAVLVAADIWLDPTALARLNAVTILPELQGIDRALSEHAHRTRYVVVPSYLRPGRREGRTEADGVRLQTVDEELRALSERADVLSVIELQGKPVRLNKVAGRRARPEVATGLTIFELAPEQQ
jgi:hypothetical protein